MLFEFLTCFSLNCGCAPRTKTLYHCIARASHERVSAINSRPESSLCVAAGLQRSQMCSWEINYCPDTQWESTECRAARERCICIVRCAFSARERFVCQKVFVCAGAHTSPTAYGLWTRHTPAATAASKSCTGKWENFSTIAFWRYFTVDCSARAKVFLSSLVIQQALDQKLLGGCKHF